MRSFIIAAALLAAVSTAAPAQPAPPPKLLIVISVDSLSGDLFDEYRPHFTGGLSRLASGTVFRNGYQGHAATETCPGHSTILTGVRPARNGIVANTWRNPAAPRADKAVYCAEDEATPGSTSTAYTVSPVHLRVPTLGDLLTQRSPGSRNVAVGGKDRSAVMMSGRSADQRWYFKGTSFATDRGGPAIPRAVTMANAFMARTLAGARPALDAPPLCAAKSRVFPIPGGGKPVGGGRFGRAAGEAAFRASPEFDATLLALAAGLVHEMQLGRRQSPDILSVGLAGTDFVGHTFGSGGQEMCLQLLSLDRDLGDFFALLDRWRFDYAVALTADHGVLDIPERLRARGVAGAAWVDAALNAEVIGEQVARSLDLKGPLIADGGPAGDIYLDPGLQGSDRARALEALRAAYNAHPQVHSAFTKDQVMRSPLPAGPPDRWSVIERVRASYDAERSGDMYVVLKPHIMPILDTSSYVATHGSPWDYDRRLPMIFWRPGMPSVTREEAVETVDIMPTLAAMLNLRGAASGVDGRCLGGIAGVACERP